MHYLFEEGDFLNRPFECFYFDTKSESFPVKPHWHNYMEIIYMLEGFSEMHSGEEKYFLRSGDMILFHPKTVHSIFSADGKPLRYAVLKFDINRLSITSDYAPKLRSIFRSAEKKSMNIFFGKDITEKISASLLFETCINEVREHKYGFDLVIRSAIYQLLIKLLRLWQEEGFSIDNEVFAQDDSYDIFSITEYIDKHIGDGIKVTEIAEKCGMSYSYFAKKFLSVYGKSCKEYIEMMRLFKAEEFLLFTDFDLNYISQETGFSDCSHMIKSFKRSRGVTPKQFRTSKRTDLSLK